MYTNRDQIKLINEPLTDRELSSATGARFRERVASVLEQLAVQAEAALANEGIKLSLFFTIPTSDPGILHVGTLADPDDAMWERVTTIVRTVLRELTGLDNIPGRDLLCAMAK